LELVLCVYPVMTDGHFVPHGMHFGDLYLGKVNFVVADEYEDKCNFYGRPMPFYSRIEKTYAFSTIILKIVSQLVMCIKLELYDQMPFWLMCCPVWVCLSLILVNLARNLHAIVKSDPPRLWS